MKREAAQSPAALDSGARPEPIRGLRGDRKAQLQTYGEIINFRFHYKKLWKYI